MPGRRQGVPDHNGGGAGDGMEPAAIELGAEAGNDGAGRPFNRAVEQGELHLDAEQLADGNRGREVLEHRAGRKGDGHNQGEAMQREAQGRQRSRGNASRVAVNVPQRRFTAFYGAL